MHNCIQSNGCSDKKNSYAKMFPTVMLRKQNSKLYQLFYSFDNRNTNLSL